MDRDKVCELARQILNSSGADATTRALVANTCAALEPHASTEAAREAVQAKTQEGLLHPDIAELIKTASFVAEDIFPALARVAAGAQNSCPSSSQEAETPVPQMPLALTLNCPSGVVSVENHPKITALRFGLTKGNYRTPRLEAEAEVREGESPEETLLKLRSWVSGQIGESPEVVETESQIRETKKELSSLQGKLSAVRETYRVGLGEYTKLLSKYGELKEILRSHGVEINDTTNKVPTGQWRIGPLPTG